MPAEREKERTEKKEAEREQLLGVAAEDYLRHAKQMTMDDTVSGNNYWKAAQLLDESGGAMRSIEVYEKFVMERPRDPRVPEAMLSIGQLYESVGKLDKAIVYYRRNIDENPRTTAAYTVGGESIALLHGGVGAGEVLSMRSERC